MSPELSLLLLAVLAYLGVLFVVAYVAERGWLPARLVRHPLTYTLSLGVYATAWTYYGGVGLAAEQGYLFLTIYIGATLSFLLAPVLLRPLLRLVRDYQLTSLADLLAFRFPSRYTGVLVTLLMLTGLLPYIALQIEAVTTTAQVLTQAPAPAFLAPLFCLTITLFAVLFGARQVTPREKHEGLVVAIAFESAVKLIAVLAVSAYALFGVFGGFSGLQHWTAQHSADVAALYAPLGDGAWTTMLLLSAAAAFLLPRQFQMIFTENIAPRTLATASWAFPLLLLLLNLGVPVLLWAGRALQLQAAPDYYLLALSLREPSGLLTVLAFVGGMSAASAMIVVESLALAAMVMNHLVLPLMLRLRLAQQGNLYGALLWGRRMLIAAVIFTGYATFLLIERSHGLARLGLVSFVAVAQFLPAVIALLSWSRATRVGFLCGVSGGWLVWFLMLVRPLLWPQAPALLPQLGLDVWSEATFWSLSVNAVLFVGGSLLSRPSVKEQAADQACRLDAVLLLSETQRWRSVRHLEARLARHLGADTARAEVSRALSELGLARDERRARTLHFLRERVERNLSGLIGPLLARKVLAASPQREGRVPHSALVEEELERSQSRLHGLAAELNVLRRFHRQVLLDLPVGVCSLGAAREVLLWNARMAEIAGLPQERVLGERLAELPAPWGEVLEGFAASGRSHDYKRHIELPGESHGRWLNLHHEALAGAAAGGVQAILLVEDLSEQQRLEAELAHSERLASIGTFAAGVAHEIGNPLTGISSIVQNLRAEATSAELHQDYEVVLAQTRRISDIVRSLLNFAHAGSAALQLSEFDLLECVNEAVRLARLSPSGRELQFDTHAVPALRVYADRGRLLQVLVNLLSNAADASPLAARVEVQAQQRLGDVPPALLLSVRDRGPGIPLALRERVFEPFFTTKDPGHGTGLGLPLVYSIVREHGGSVSLLSREGGGMSVLVRLPQAQWATTAAATPMTN